MPDLIANARAEFLQAKAALLHALATTPDGRLRWSPSPTSRTPLQIAAHAANSVGNILRTLQGDTYAVPTTAEADRSFRAWESGITTREGVLEVIEANSTAFVAWLDELMPDQLQRGAEMPFRMGKFPLSMGITFPTKHTLWHVAQIEYVQTIYGDHDWHVPYGR